MKCPLCGSQKFKSKIIKTQEVDSPKLSTLLECLFCELAFTDDFLDDRNFIYGNNYIAWHQAIDNDENLIAASKKITFKKQLGSLFKYIDPKDKTILDIGTGNGYLLEIARKMGFDCYGIDISPNSAEIARKIFFEKIKTGSFLEIDYPDNFFDVICITDVLEHISNPHKMFSKINKIIKSGGYIFVISPNYGSITRKILNKKWFQFKYEHVLYYNQKSFKYLMDYHNYQILHFNNNIKFFSLYYYFSYFKKYSLLNFSKYFNILKKFIPFKIQAINFPNPISGEFLAIVKSKKHE